MRDLRTIHEMELATITESIKRTVYTTVNAIFSEPKENLTKYESMLKRAYIERYTNLHGKAPETSSFKGVF